jgi:hypothetical protein
VVFILVIPPSAFVLLEVTFCCAVLLIRPVCAVFSEVAIIVCSNTLPIIAAAKLRNIALAKRPTGKKIENP